MLKGTGNIDSLHTVAAFNKSIPAFWKFVIAIVLCQVVGLTSGVISNSGMTTWYEALNKPGWTPPAAVFAPVWTILYLLMGIALGLVWIAHTERLKEKTALFLFALQLFLNFWWSIIFFGFHAPGWAFLEICVLIVMIMATLSEFSRIHKTAGRLLIPYLLWVCFAAMLNAAIWQMN